MTYNIKSIDELEASTAALASSNQKVTNNANSLSYILNQIKENWQNEAGSDLASFITELEKCINSIQYAISPTVTEYVKTMNTLAAESRSTQSKTL